MGWSILKVGCKANFLCEIGARLFIECGKRDAATGTGLRAFLMAGEGARPTHPTQRDALSTCQAQEMQSSGRWAVDSGRQKRSPMHNICNNRLVMRREEVYKGTVKLEANYELF